MTEDLEQDKEEIAPIVPTIGGDEVIDEELVLGAEDPVADKALEGFVSEEEEIFAVTPKLTPEDEEEIFDGSEYES